MTHANIITTEDGYMYEQLPSGWYTDGDIEFDYDNTDIMGVVWQNIDGHYCADGDGLIVVIDDEHGNFDVLDQGDIVSRHDNLRDAMFAAQALLAKDYPSIYADLIGE